MLMLMSLSGQIWLQLFFNGFDTVGPFNVFVVYVHRIRILYDNNNLRMLSYSILAGWTVQIIKDVISPCQTQRAVLSSLNTSVIHFRNSNQLHIREVVHPSFLDSEDESQGGSIEGVAQCAGRGRGGAGEWQKVRCLDRSVIWRTRRPVHPETPNSNQ